MKDILTWLIAIIVAAAALMWATAQNNEAAARRAYAAAAMVREQSQARLDLATALMPYFALTAVIVVTLATVAIVIYALARSGDRTQPTRLIETRTIILLAPGQSRRDVWRQLSQAAEVKLIRGNRDEIL
jgi:amino acid permease